MLEPIVKRNEEKVLAPPVQAAMTSEGQKDP